MAGQQPNFNAMANNMHNMATEVQNMANIPAVTGGAQILAVLQTMSGQLRAIETRLDTIDNHLDEIDQHLEGIDDTISSMTANIHNNAAIVQNGRLFSGAQPLAELHDPDDNSRIPIFPQTGDALKAMNCKAVI